MRDRRTDEAIAVEKGYGKGLWKTVHAMLNGDEDVKKGWPGNGKYLLPLMQQIFP